MSHNSPAAAPLETIYVDSPHVACDGGGGALGHPRIWFTLDKDPSVDCPYCGRRYILKNEDARVQPAHTA